MDQKLNAKTSVWASVIGIICGLIMLPVAIGAIASFPNSIGWLGLLLIVCSAMVSISSFKNLRKSRKGYKSTEEHIQDLMTAVVPPSKVSAEGGMRKPFKFSPTTVILANWEYSAQEWKNFLHWEKKYKTSSSFIIFFVLLILGSILIEIRTGSGWFNSFLLSLPCVAVFIWVLAAFRRSSFGIATGHNKNRVILTNQAVIINKRLNEFATEEKSIKEVRIIEEAVPKILEIEYKWLTRGVVSSDRIYIPIPKGRLGEAVVLIDKLSSPGVVFV